MFLFLFYEDKKCKFLKFMYTLTLDHLHHFGPFEGKLIENTLSRGEFKRSCKNRGFFSVINV